MSIITEYSLWLILLCIALASFTTWLLYFHRVNQELIEKMKMDGKRVVQKKHLTLISSDHKEQLHETSPPVKAQDAVKKAA